MLRALSATDAVSLSAAPVSAATTRTDLRGASQRPESPVDNMSENNVEMIFSGNRGKGEVGQLKLIFVDNITHLKKFSAGPKTTSHLHSANWVLLKYVAKFGRHVS